MQMAARCPNCNQEISPWGIRNDFSCPNCNAALSANATARTLLALVIWVVLDLPILLVGQAAAGDSSLLYALYYGLPSAALGLVIFWFVFSGADVSLREPQRSGG
jgi:predicted RNA-binding Zn-ribbon protein involved in translation (DUF1610 family)